MAASQAGKPVIEVPMCFVNRLEKIRARRDEGRKRWLTKYGVPAGSRLVVSCKDDQLNHYEGQRYPKKAIMLASAHWTKNKYKGDHFTLNSYARNPALISKYLSDVNFSQFGLNQRVFQAIDEMKIRFPTNVQALGIPILMQYRNALLAAETGSGKTIAYMAPMLSLLELWKNMEGSEVTIGSPKGLVLAPSRELAEQLYDVLQRLSAYTNLSSLLCVTQSRVQKALEEPQDVLIGTPGTLLKLTSLGDVNLHNLAHFVIDEADSLLDDSFSGDVLELTKGIQFQIHRSPSGHRQPGTQLILASATVPTDLHNILDGLCSGDNLDEIRTDGLHKVMPHVSQKFIRLLKPDMMESLLRIVRRDCLAKRKVLIFVNTTHTCVMGRSFLENNNIMCKAMHGKLSADERESIFQDFHSGKFNVLISTDLASRGLDTTSVDHVINYDFPRYISDYVHRVGRVGRVGAPRIGNVTNFVTKSDVDLVQTIEETVRRNTSLRAVDANIKRQMSGAEIEDPFNEDADHQLQI